MKKSYAEQLSDPRWQKMRLRLLDAAEWTCCDCGEKNKTLHVHHLYYEPKTNAWEYPDEAYMVLCSDCHKLIGNMQVELQKQIAKVMHKSIPVDFLAGLIGFVKSSPFPPLSAELCGTSVAIALLVRDAIRTSLVKVLARKQ